jgi:hypothetical protein
MLTQAMGLNILCSMSFKTLLGPMDKTTIKGSKETSQRRKKTKKRHRRMNRQYPRSYHRGNWNTAQRLESIGTAGWTDGPFSTCVRWIEETKQRSQKRRMTRRSIGGHRRSIRWLVWTRQRRAKTGAVAPDEPMVQAVVHLMVTKRLTVRIWRGTLQHRMNRRTVMCQWSCAMEGNH